MGKKIAAFYAEAERLGGLEAKIQLATLTRTTSTRAQIEPDTPANVARFEQALVAVRALFAASAAEARKPAHSAPAAPAPPLPGGEEVLWGVLSSLHDAMVAAFDREGRCVLNFESKSLAKRYGAAGEAIARAIGTERRADIEAIFAGAEPIQAESPITLGGHEAWLSVALAPVHDAQGSVTRVAAFVQDVSERKRHEARLRESERRLREHTRTFLDLVAHKSVFLGDVAETNRRITEAAAQALGVARASVWFYDAHKTKIVCADLFERDGAKHAAGVELMAEQFPAYFGALELERTIAANDAHGDPRTAEFSAPYLAPLGINSMLDVPIWVGGEMIGVVCNEHIGPAREWTPDEENFAYLMANFVALAKEMARRPA